MTLHTGSITAPLRRRHRAGGITPKRITVLLALIALAGIAGYAAYTRLWSTGGPQAAAYSVSDVARQTVSSTVNVSGTASADRQVKLSFATAGRVSTLSVKQGDSVQAGQEIAALDTTASRSSTTLPNRSSRQRRRGCRICWVAPSRPTSPPSNRRWPARRRT